MEQANSVKQSKARLVNATTVLIRVKRETKKWVLAELAKLNKKDFGRKIRCDDLISLAMSLVKDHHLKELQNTSLSNADRLELQYREYVKKHGPLTKDEFLGVILSGSVVHNGPAKPVVS